MKLVAAAAVLSSIAPVVATADKEYTFDEIPAAEDLSWYPCNLAFTCARLSVPLNPLKPNNGLRSEIPLVLYPADPSDEYKGAVLVNPGGPGISGTDFILQAAPVIANLTGPGWDIIGFDTRGTGYSKPNGAVGYHGVPLVPEVQNATNILSDNVTKGSIRKFKRRSELKIPYKSDAWLQKQYEDGEELNTLIQKYANKENQAVPYMTTPHVAFDMLQIAKAHARSEDLPDKDVLVNYYGSSYGTLLGQTFASLYPQHVGKFVLEGVVDMKAYYGGSLGPNHLDKTISNFVTTCSDAGPKGCAFATGKGRDDVLKRFNDLMAHFDSAKAVAENWANATIVEEAHDVVRGIFTSVGYDAQEAFPILADQLVLLEGWVKSNTVAENREKLLSWIASPFSFLTRKEYYYEILCSDMAGNEFVGSKKLSKEFVDSVRSGSTVAGDTLALTYAICSSLDLKPNWKFNGTVGGETKTPMLFVGVSGDPVTPAENAEGAQKLYKNSEMVHVEGDAHSIIYLQNKCANDNVKVYFQNLTLPGNNNRCARDTAPIFPKSNSAGLSPLKSLDGFGRTMALTILLFIGLMF
ncbi:hypothetical protein TWF718_003045 [Orbilia javanica]|uniref:Uncharacterized protein n=1 Tax=Orbilia javanica TaxID=47235 RepID=A0AAN8RJA9_9PEZI